MKSFLLLSGCLWFAFFTAEARTWFINNDDSSADFSQIKNAHDSNQVVDGNALIVEVSKYVYDSFDSCKRLTIVRPGYFLIDKRFTANQLTANISQIDFLNDSEDSVIVGLTFNVNSNLIGEREEAEKMILNPFLSMLYLYT